MDFNSLLESTAAPLGAVAVEKAASSPEADTSEEVDATVDDEESVDDIDASVPNAPKGDPVRIIKMVFDYITKVRERVFSYSYVWQW